MPGDGLDGTAHLALQGGPQTPQVPVVEAVLQIIRQGELRQLGRTI